jgi:hypothetical protein
MNISGKYSDKFVVRNEHRTGYADSKSEAESLAASMTYAHGTPSYISEVSVCESAVLEKEKEKKEKK